MKQVTGCKLQDRRISTDYAELVLSLPKYFADFFSFFFVGPWLGRLYSPAQGCSPVSPNFRAGRGFRHFAGRAGWPALRWTQWLLLVTFLVLFMAGCGGGDQSEAVSDLEAKLAQDAEVFGTSAEVFGTSGEQAITAEEANEQQDQPAQEVAEEPTVDFAATEAADALRLTAEAEQAAATATETARAATLEPIRAEVATYGVDPNQGNLGFIHPPVSIEENDFEDFDWRNQNLFTIARDFVLVADITWNSAFAESGCGFVVRSDGDEENPSSYLVGLTRGAQGHVLFAEQVEGDVDLNLVTDIYANGIDPKFEWQNDTTNRIAVVGRGQEFTIYSNGTRLGTITGQAGFEEGFVAFFAVNRSGGIRCDFNNAWLWRMN